MLLVLNSSLIGNIVAMLHNFTNGFLQHICEIDFV